MEVGSHNAFKAHSIDRACCVVLSPTANTKRTSETSPSKCPETVAGAQCLLAGVLKFTTVWNDC